MQNDSTLSTVEVVTKESPNDCLMGKINNPVRESEMLRPLQCYSSETAGVTRCVRPLNQGLEAGAPKLGKTTAKEH